MFARILNILLAAGACVALYFIFEGIEAPRRDTFFGDLRRGYPWMWDLRYLLFGVFAFVLFSVLEWINGKVQARLGKVA